MRVWHVSAPVDLIAYHFSWLPAALAFLVLRDSHAGIAIVAAVGAVLNTVHRNWTMVYAYGDSSVRRRHAKRLWGTLAALALALGALAALMGTGMESAYVSAFVVIAGPVNVYHVQMQKFGFLRMYARKGQEELGAVPVAPRSDKLLLFGWMPAVLAAQLPYAGQFLRAKAGDYGALYDTLAAPVLEFRGALAVVGAAAWAVSLALWVRAEWRSSRFANRPRVWAAAGTVGLASSFFWLPPLHAFMAYGFGHAVEYLVFAWAFQRRRGERERKPSSWMAAHWRPAFVFSLAGLALYSLWFSIVPWAGLSRNLASLGAPLKEPFWVFAFGMIQQHAHYFIDSFIWKMRDPDVFRNV